MGFLRSGGWRRSGRRVKEKKRGGKGEKGGGWCFCDLFLVECVVIINRSN